MITRGEVGNLLQQNILEDKREHSEAAMALVHLKEQHRDIMQLEASILELHQVCLALYQHRDQMRCFSFESVTLPGKQYDVLTLFFVCRSSLTLRLSLRRRMS